MGTDEEKLKRQEALADLRAKRYAANIATQQTRSKNMAANDLIDVSETDDHAPPGFLLLRESNTGTQMRIAIAAIARYFRDPGHDRTAVMLAGGVGVYVCSTPQQIDASIFEACT